MLFSNIINVTNITNSINVKLSELELTFCSEYTVICCKLTDPPCANFTHNAKYKTKAKHQQQNARQTKVPCTLEDGKH